MLYHFSQQDGKKAFEAGDARKEEAIVNFMRNPKEPPPPPPPEKPWSDEPSEVVHLTEDSFGNSLSMTRNVQANINCLFFCFRYLFDAGEFCLSHVLCPLVWSLQKDET